MNEPGTPRTVELSPLLAGFIEQEVTRTGLSAEEVVAFALGVLAHCQRQTADGDLLIRAEKGTPDGFTFRSWALPEAIGSLATTAARQGFALEMSKADDDEPRPHLRIVRATSDD